MRPRITIDRTAFYVLLGGFFAAGLSVGFLLGLVVVLA